MCPKPEVPPKKVWSTPEIERIELGTPPYANLVEILRALLAQVEKDLSLNPTDPRSNELRRSIRRRLDDLGSKGTDAA